MASATERRLQPIGTSSKVGRRSDVAGLGRPAISERLFRGFVYANLFGLTKKGLPL